MSLTFCTDCFPNIKHLGLVLLLEIWTLGSNKKGVIVYLVDHSKTDSSKIKSSAFSIHFNAYISDV